MQQNNNQVVSADFEQFGQLTGKGLVILNAAQDTNDNLYQIHIYILVKLGQQNSSNQSRISTCLVVPVFIIAIICILINNCWVKLRQHGMKQLAARTSTIVQQLFEMFFLLC